MATIEGFAEEVLESESDIASNTSEISNDESSDNESQHEHNDDLASTRDKLADWFLGLNDEQINLRKNCVKIHVLAPFLLGIIPPQYEEKFISWSFECGLLPTNEVKQDFDPTNEAFENIQIVENGFEALSQIMNKKQIIIQMLELKNQLVNCTSYKRAFKCAKKKDWFLCERDVCLPKDVKVERAIMALLLTAYQFAVHIQLSYVKKTDLLTISSSSKDCKEVEEKTLKLKENGNEEFRSKNYEGAITFYSKAIHESPFNHIVYGNRAQSYKNLGEYRKALMDAKRTIILKPDWDKGLYRFKEAAAALQDGEGGKASFLSFCVDKHIIDDETKQSRAQDVKKQNSVTTNE
ncbi:E3 ubiquitin-protein ligase TTC3-like [Xenia sp. Carnegie-2017]|uniref:E3 ubiquitin-protein ligase TTC3-like n=1 Tax=Xenia sp. Carnegie-2017 TaxID=2897299 RepID=UPI001F041DF7|nr:E3 ubiquitin-protein ligase TTC3-like [Xenia sp. Carnegie-2017]